MSILFDSKAVKSIDNETVKQIAFSGMSAEVMRQLDNITEQVLCHHKFKIS